MTSTETITQPSELRAMADVLDTLPGLPALYIVFNASGGVSIQIPTHLPLSDQERMDVADRLAAALGVECGKRSDEKEEDGTRTWTYGTPYFVEPAIYAPGIRAEVPT